MVGLGEAVGDGDGDGEAIGVGGANGDGETFGEGLDEGALDGPESVTPAAGFSTWELILIPLPQAVARVKTVKETEIECIEAPMTFPPSTNKKIQMCLLTGIRIKLLNFFRIGTISMIADPLLKLSLFEGKNMHNVSESTQMVFQNYFENSSDAISFEMTRC